MMVFGSWVIAFTATGNVVVEYAMYDGPYL